MALMQNSSSRFFSRLTLAGHNVLQIIVGIAILVSLMTATPLLADETEQRQIKLQLPKPPGSEVILEQGSPGTCPKPKYPPRNSLFRNLTRVALFVDVPSRYDYAAKCHAREEGCVDANGGVVIPSQRDRARKELVDDYKAFPPALHSDNLARLFSKQLEAQLSPYLVRDSNCQVSDVILLDQEHMERFRSQPDVLTIVLKVRIQETSNPRLAILSTHYYRPDLSVLSVRQTAWTGDITGILLNVPDDDIARSVTEFVQRLGPLVAPAGP